MDYQKINYLTSIVIKDETFFIYLDDTYKFVAIHYKEAPELCNGRANVVWGRYLTFDSYEATVEYLNVQSDRVDDDYEPKDPEERHWENVATFNERFSGDY